MRRLLPLALLLLVGCSSGPVLDTNSMIGPLAALLAPWAWCRVFFALGLALGWWGCWWMVTHNNPGVDLKMPHRAALKAVKSFLSGRKPPFAAA
jgi:hypothetical protein